MGLDQRIIIFKDAADAREVVRLDEEAHGFECMGLPEDVEKNHGKIAEIEGATDNLVWYGRKVNCIHGWVEDEYGPDINVRYLAVNAVELHDAVKSKLAALRSKDTNPDNPDLMLLPPTAGFFFGSQNEDEFYLSDLEELDKFLDDAAAEYDELHAVYWSWY